MRNCRLLTWLVILLATVAMLFGGLWWQERAMVGAYRDAAVCSDVVRAGGAAYGGVRVTVTSHPRAAVVGFVGSDADRQRLRRELAGELGEERFARVAVQVRVDGEAIVRSDPPAEVGGR